MLLEDIPGVGKTTLALSFAKVMGVDYHRIQFTPDVTPSDVVGFSLYDRQSGEFQYKPGAVMCNLLLADEINRTSSKTQAALLEVMEEGNATVDGKTYEIPKPFTVIATQIVSYVPLCAFGSLRWIVLWSNSPWVIRTLKARSISCGIVRRSSRWICFR